MGEVHHADDAEDHRIADGDEAVDRAERDAVDELLNENRQLLDEDVHALSASLRGLPPRSGNRSGISIRVIAERQREPGFACCVIKPMMRRRTQWDDICCYGCWACRSRF